MINYGRFKYACRKTFPSEGNIMSVDNEDLEVILSNMGKISEYTIE